MRLKNDSDKRMNVGKVASRPDSTIAESLNSFGYSVDPWKERNASTPKTISKTQIFHSGFSISAYKTGSSLAVFISHRYPRPYAGNNRPSKNSQLTAMLISLVERLSDRRLSALMQIQLVILLVLAGKVSLKLQALKDCAQQFIADLNTPGDALADFLGLDQQLLSICHLPLLYRQDCHG